MPLQCWALLWVAVCAGCAGEAVTQPEAQPQPEARVVSDPPTSPEPEPAPATIRLTCEPPDASVVIGDFGIGTTPHELPRPEGDDVVTLFLVHHGFRPLEVTLNADSDAQIHVTLEPIREVSGCWPCPSEDEAPPSAESSEGWGD